MTALFGLAVAFVVATLLARDSAVAHSGGGFRTGYAFAS